MEQKGELKAKLELLARKEKGIQSLKVEFSSFIKSKSPVNNKLLLASPSFFDTFCESKDFGPEKWNIELKSVSFSSEEKDNDDSLFDFSIEEPIYSCNACLKPFFAGSIAEHCESCFRREILHKKQIAEESKPAIIATTSTEVPQNNSKEDEKIDSKKQVKKEKVFSFVYL